MVERILKQVQMPRLWLSAGFMCLGIFVLLGYHQDQVAADSVLAEKIRTPSVVRIQDFDPSRNSNILREVQVLAEADLAHSLRLNVGSEDSSKVVEVIPVFAVTSVSEPLAAAEMSAESGLPRRPVPRSEAAALASRADGMRNLEHTPLGLIVSEGLAVNDLTVVGEGLNGSLVRIFGADIGNGQVFERASVMLAARDLTLLPDLPVIWLYPDRQRPHTVAADYSALRHILGLVVIALVLTAGMFAIIPFRRTAKPHEAFEEVQAVGEFPGVSTSFRREDEERIRNEQDASERRAAQTRRVKSRMVSET